LLAAGKPVGDVDFIRGPATRVHGRQQQTCQPVSEPSKFNTAVFVE
jgi:hypothetical protein